MSDDAGVRMRIGWVSRRRAPPGGTRFIPVCARGAVAQWRRTNILLNAAGHNVPGTMLAARGPISDLFIEACHQANDFYRLVRCSRAEHPAAKAATKMLVLGLQIELARSHGERILLNATGPNVLLRSESGV